MDEGQSFSQRDQAPHRHPAITILIVIVFLEAAELLVATVASGVAIATASDTERGVMIALAVTVLLLFVGIAMVGWGLLVGRKHLLGAVLTWQVLVIAISLGAFEGVIGGPGFWWLGLVLLIPALVAGVCSVLRPVTAVYTREPRVPETQADRARRAVNGRDTRTKTGPTPKRDAAPKRR